MSKEPQVEICKECRDKETCEFSSADKEQCDVVDVIRDEKYRCLLEKGHEGSHTWWKAPCRAILLAPNPYNTLEYREAMWDTI